MQCVNCNSENVQRLSLVYDQGTEDIYMTSHTYAREAGWGAGLGLNHGLGFGSTGGIVANTTTTGTSQTRSAQKAAPPVKKNYVKTAFSIFGALFLIGIRLPIFSLPLFGTALYTFLDVRKYNKDVFPLLMYNWQNSWQCNRCGEVYVQ